MFVLHAEFLENYGFFEVILIKLRKGVNLRIFVLLFFSMK